MGIRSKIVGTNRRNQDGVHRQDIIANLLIGDRLYLADYSSDEYPYAMGVETNDYKLCGFVSERISREIKSLCIPLEEIPVIVEDICASNDGSYTCSILVDVQQDPIRSNKPQMSTLSTSPHKSAYKVHAKKKKKKIWRLAIIPLPVIVLILAIVIWLPKSPAPTPSTSHPAPTSSTQLSANQPEEVYSTSAPTEAPLPQHLSIGTMSTLRDWEITPQAFEIVKKIENNDYWSFAADDGNMYVVIYLNVKNIGTDMNTFLPSYGFSNRDISVKIFYQGAYEYSRTTLIGYDKDLSNKSLNPLTTADGAITFSLPDDIANSSDLELVFSIGNDTAKYMLN